MKIDIINFYSIANKIDLLDRNENQLGYYQRNVTGSLTTNQYQYVDNSASSVALVNAHETTGFGKLFSWNFNSRTNFTPRENSLNLAIYDLDADVQQ